MSIHNVTGFERYRRLMADRLAAEKKKNKEQQKQVKLKAAKPKVTAEVTAEPIATGAGDKE